MYRTPLLPTVAMNNQPRFTPPFRRQNNFSRGKGPLQGYQLYRWKSPNSGQVHNEEYWCETCDRGFPNMGLLENHKQQHQKCNIDGCQFIAHPKVITKHIQMQHSTGLFKKIGNLSNPEDIQKWREERKKKYPTKENVEKKNAEIKEKIERGEKIGLRNNKEFRKYSQDTTAGEPQKRKYPFENKRNNNHRRRGPPVQIKNKKVMPSKKINDIPPADESRKLTPFAGFQYLMMEEINSNESDDATCDYLIEDDDANIAQEEPMEISSTDKPSVCSALSSLMCNYGSSDDENDEQTTKNQSNRVSKNTSEINTSFNTTDVNRAENPKLQPDATEDKKENDDDSGPEEVKVEKPTEAELENKTDQIPRDTKVKKQEKFKKELHNKKPVVKPKSKLPSTLLEKLLHREIKQERNIVLQCVRHIVKNNFFDK